MSFIRPSAGKGAGGLSRRRALSASAANRGRGRFQRRGLRPSVSVQSFASGAAVNGAHYMSQQQLDIAASMIVDEQCTGSGSSSDDIFESMSAYDGDSVFSDFDLVNDTIQDYLLASEDSDESEDEMDPCAALAFSPFVCATPARTLSRRQTAKKERRTAAPGPSPAPQLRRVVSSQVLQETAEETTAAVSPASRSLLTPQPLRESFRIEKNRKKKDIETARGRKEKKKQRLLPALRPSALGVPLAPLTVVLDLDETLVSARSGPIYIRPFTRELVDTCAELRCELVVWTAGVPQYVNPILHAIAKVCGRTCWFQHIISRHRRWYDGAADCVKDLRALGRPAERVLVLENNPVSVMRQPRNAVLVEDYMQPNAQDDSLRILTEIVRRVAGKLARGDEGEEEEEEVMSRDSTSVMRLLDSEERDGALTSACFAWNAVNAKEGKTETRSNAPHCEGALRCRILQYATGVTPRSYGGLTPLPNDAS